MVIDFIKELDEHYYMGVFGDRYPAAFTHGVGMRLYDTMGNSYVDFLSGIGVNALGYSDKTFKHEICEQVEKLIHSSNLFYNEEQAHLAQDLCVRTGYDKVFIANSGAEANECAIKLAIRYGKESGKSEPNFVALNHSFHGRTLATLSATGKDAAREPYEPGAIQVRFIEPDDVPGAERAIDKNTCGVLIEIIQGEGGVLPLSAMFVKAIRRLCDENDALLIIDEVQTGMGRTGRLLAQEFAGVKADITTLAKALGNGIPIGACLATTLAADAFRVGDHGSTFGGNHLACVAARYMIRVLDDKMLDDITEIGENFKYELFKMAGAHHDEVAEVRGLGLMLGMQLRDHLDVSKVARQLFDLGFIVGTAGRNTLRFLPPFIVSDNDVEQLTGALDYALGGKA